MFPSAFSARRLLLAVCSLSGLFCRNSITVAGLLLSQEIVDFLFVKPLAIHVLPLQFFLVPTEPPRVGPVQEPCPVARVAPDIPKEPSQFLLYRHGLCRLSKGDHLFVRHEEVFFDQTAAQPR